MTVSPVDAAARQESGYGVLFRNVAASIRESDPDAAQALDRAAVTVEELVTEHAEAASLLAVREADLERLADEFEKAAQRWRETAAVDRVEGSVSDMAGEHGVPSHVISTARAITWAAAASDLRAALAAVPDDPVSEGDDG